MNANLRKCMKDLRSGEFPQGLGALRTKRGYCCLGVICERYRRETGKGSWEPNTGDPGGAYVFRLPSGTGDTMLLPGEVQKWAGLTGANPRLSKGEFISAATANDHEVPFPEIADLFEATYGA